MFSVLPPPQHLPFPRAQFLADLVQSQAYEDFAMTPLQELLQRPDAGLPRTAEHGLGTRGDQDHRKPADLRLRRHALLHYRGMGFKIAIDHLVQGYFIARPTPTPPRIKGYLRLGAHIAGEPAWDSDFNCADVFILLPVSRLNAPYAKHFMRKAA